MRFAIFATALLLVCTMASVAVSVVAQPILLQDLQSRGSNLHYFNKVPSVLFVNQARGGASISGRTMTLGAQTAEFNPDLGFVLANTGVQVGSTNSRPTCAAARRGEYWTSRASTDAGDISYQCCLDGTGYAWKLGFCQ